MKTLGMKEGGHYTGMKNMEVKCNFSPNRRKKACYTYPKFGSPTHGDIYTIIGNYITGKTLYYTQYTVYHCCDIIALQIQDGVYTGASWVIRVKKTIIFNLF